MKKFFILFCFLFSISIMGCASVTLQSSQSIVELSGLTKTQIFEKSKQWITYKFASGRAVMDYVDLKTGRIIAKGNITVATVMGSRLTTDFIATIDSVNGKAKIEVLPEGCSQIAPNGNIIPCECTSFYMTVSGMKNMVVSTESLVQSYVSYMKDGKAQSWDGN